MRKRFLRRFWLTTPREVSIYIVGLHAKGREFRPRNDEVSHFIQLPAAAAALYADSGYILLLRTLLASMQFHITAAHFRLD